MIGSILMRTKVVGISYRPGSHDHLLQKAEGDCLQLVREPENEYDENAIAVYDGEFKLGFIPREDAKQVAPVMDSGAVLEATITGYNGLVIRLIEQG